MRLREVLSVEALRSPAGAKNINTSDCGVSLIGDIYKTITGRFLQRLRIRRTLESRFRGCDWLLQAGKKKLTAFVIQISLLIALKMNDRWDAQGMRLLTYGVFFFHISNQKKRNVLEHS